MDTYPDQENIVFCYDKPEKFLLDYKIQENYSTKMYNMLRKSDRKR